MYVTNKMANIEVFNGPIRLNSDRDTLGKCFYLMSGNVIIVNIYVVGFLPSQILLYLILQNLIL